MRVAAGERRAYPLTLLVAFLVVAVALGVRPVSRIDWVLENILVVLFVGFLVLSRRRLPLSDLSYSLIFVYLVLHEIGAHYTYSLVPIDWQTLGFARNHYDRVVHFSFGLLLALPFREWFRTVARTRGFWSYYLPLDVVLASSVAYEIIEWIVAQLVDPAAGIAWLGAQGDDFDAVKDMASGGLGALLAMTAALLVHWRREPGFGAELHESLRVPLTDPMGEVDRRKWKEGAR